MALLDPSRLPTVLLAVHLVTLERESGRHHHVFCKRLLAADEVQQVYDVSGDWDYVVITACSGMAHHTEVADRLFMDAPNVVLSLPIVALVSAVLPGVQKATQLGYVALLLGLALVLGYLASLVRGTRPTKAMLGKLGYRIEPEGTIYAQTLKHMSDEATVIVELKDGRRVCGCPRSGPQSKDDAVQELYLVYPEALGDDGEWRSAGPGVIVPLSEVNHIVLSEEPTGAPAR